MHITELQATWNALAKADPLWAILSAADKKGNLWQTDEFFQTGIAHVAELIAYIRSLPVPFPTGRALDFGCGVGRVTQALVPHFAEVHGVDISAAMLELAQTYNRYEATCRYHLNESTDLNLFADRTFAFAYSLFTLQHMEPQYSLCYLRELVRVLAPGGLLVFQLPSGLSGLPKQAAGPPEPDEGQMPKMKIEMHPIESSEVLAALTAGGAEIVDRQPDPTAGREWISFRYCATRP